jgi:hypothetical protein
LNPLVTPELEAVIMTALAKAPQARFQSVGKFAEALKRLELTPGA